MNKILLLIFCLVFTGLQAQRLSREEVSLIVSGRADAKMDVTLVTNSADSLLLRKKAKRIGRVDDNVHFLAKRMLETVQNPDHAGVGIAAPQVGISRRLILVQRFDKDEKPFEAMINPVIISYSDSLCDRIEGCLSIPVIRQNVTRPYSLVLKYKTLEGKRITEKIEGFTARIVQHEVDHLNGILFVDYE
jgi:peptide deformylase